MKETCSSCPSSAQCDKGTIFKCSCGKFAMLVGKQEVKIAEDCPWAEGSASKLCSSCKRAYTPPTMTPR